MATPALPISGLVNVQASVAAAAAQAQNTTTLVILTSTTLIDLKTRMVEFEDLDDIATKFGDDGFEYEAGEVWFGQNPAPVTAFVATWAKNARAGQLICAPLSAASQLPSVYTGVADGGFTVAVDGAGAVHVAGVNLSAVGNMPAVATAINNALVVQNIGLSCVWVQYDQRFVFSSATTGAQSAVSLLTAANGAGVTDISGLIGGTAASSGAYSVPGQVAETALEAVTLLDNEFGESWYAIVIPEAADADHLAVGPYIEASSTKHFYWATSPEAAILLASSTTDIAYQLSQLQLGKTALQYSSTSSVAAASMAARIMTVDYTANSSAITEMYKQEPLVTAETLTSGQLKAMLAKNCNAFVTYKGGVTIIQPGTTCKTGQFIDTAIGVDNLIIDIQLALFNALYTTPTKIPQTDSGMQQLAGVAEGVLLQYVANGLLAPGTWTYPGFGSLKQGGTLEMGYYVYMPLIATQSAANRAARMAVPMQIAVKLAGAVQTIDALLTVNP